jgi:hypothetical protein
MSIFGKMKGQAVWLRHRVQSRFRAFLELGASLREGARRAQT